jgi:hypothetical protein
MVGNQKLLFLDPADWRFAQIRERGVGVRVQQYGRGKGGHLLLRLGSYWILIAHQCAESC